MTQFSFVLDILLNKSHVRRLNQIFLFYNKMYFRIKNLDVIKTISYKNSYLKRM